VAEVKFGETLALTDGTAVRLVNAKALAAPLSWRVVNEAKEALPNLPQAPRSSRVSIPKR
jgi:hypothetical protein